MTRLGWPPVRNSAKPIIQQRIEAMQEYFRTGDTSAAIAAGLFPETEGIMTSVALKSRLQALHETLGLSFSERDSNPTLAHRIMAENPVAWREFSKKYGIIFNPRRRAFLDLQAAARARTI